MNFNVLISRRFIAVALFCLRLSDTVWGYLELSIEAEVGCVPITTTAKLQNVVSLHHCDYIVVALEPVIARGVHPADVMTTVGGPALVGHHSDQLIVARVQARVKRSVQQVVMRLDIVLHLRSLRCSAHELLCLGALLLLLLFILHFNICLGRISCLGSLLLFLSSVFACQSVGIFFASVGCLKLTALQQRLLQLLGGELKDVEHFGEGNVSQNFGFASICASNSARLFPVESHEVDTKVFGLHYKNNKNKFKLKSGVAVVYLPGD